MKKMKKGIYAYLLLLAASVIIASCCKSEVAIIGGGSLFINQIDNQATDTIRNEFTMRVAMELEYTDIGSGIIASTYATSCEETFTNNIDQSSLRISSDKDFVFDGQTISANNSFADREELQIFFYEGEGIFEINVLDRFLDKADFEKGMYTFTVSISTDDGKSYTYLPMVYLDL